MQIRHILVSQKYEAEDIIRLLNSGKDFAQLAGKYSQCSSGKAGGSLGDVKPGQLDSDFLEALENLKIGEVSSPIRTRFGYHIIQILTK